MNLIINNLAVSYKVAGKKGPTLLYLHGWGSNKEAFDQVTKLLDNKYHIIALDMPGFGASEGPDGPWGIEEYGNFVKNFTEKLDLSPGTIIGHSMGGRIGVYIAGNKILEFNKLVLLGAHGFKESTSAKNKAYKIIAKSGKLATKPLPKGVQDKLRNKLYASAGAEDYLNAGDLKETFSKIIDFDLKDTAKKITHPTLIVYGQQDYQTPPSFGEQYNQLIEDSKLHILEDAGHYVQNDQAEKVAKLIGDFV